MSKLLQEYSDTFNENFPIYAFMGVDDAEIKRTIEKCLKEKEPYKIAEKKGVYY